MSAPTKTPKFPTPRAAANSGASDVTRAVRAGIECDDASGCVVPPLHLTSTFAFRAFGEKRTYDYTRSGNPTRDLLGQALAELEHGAGAVVTASGMAAVTVTGYLVPASGRIIVPHDCYGGTYRLFDAWRRRGERQVEFVDFGDAAALAAALARPAALLWIETPSNPLLRITDIAACAQAARAAGAITVVDNTFLSPAWQQPLTLGADLVVHSTTKYINGHSDVVGGAVIAREPALLEQLTWWANCLGLTGAPFDSFMTLRGLRTLHARLEHHGRNAQALAQWLSEQEAVRRVWYPGLPGHPGHELARRQQKGFGAVVTLELEGGEEAVREFVAGLECFSLAESLGGVESLVAHPASMTHAAMEPAALDRHRGTGGLTQ
jgi:cystathionine gamma-synthase